MSGTPEQKARDLLERMGIEDAQSFTAGDVVELANLIADTPSAPPGPSVAERIWYEEQVLQRSINQDPTNTHLHGIARGLQRARDIANGVPRSTVEELMAAVDAPDDDPQPWHPQSLLDERQKMVVDLLQHQMVNALIDAAIELAKAPELLWRPGGRQAWAHKTTAALIMELNHSGWSFGFDPTSEGT
jgi:hypothetical protein